MSNENNKAISPITFLDYDRITDTILWFNNIYSLKFFVKLKRSVNNKIHDFHQEYTKYNKRLGGTFTSINRHYSFGFSIDNREQFKDGVVLRPSDVELLRIVIENNIYPWFMSDRRIYGKDRDNRLAIKGKYEPIHFPLNSAQFLRFEPIVISYEDSMEDKEGIRITINDNDNYMDIAIDKFLEFSSYILHTDMVNAAMTLLNYVKTQPYGENKSVISQRNTNFGKVNNFFNNI